MKKTTFIFATLLIMSALAYPQSWSNSNILSGTDDLSVISTTSDSYNNTYLFGYFTGSINVSESVQIDSRGGRDFFLAKYNNASDLIWIKGFGGSLNEWTTGGLSISQDEHIYITGGFQTSLYYTPTDSIESTGLDDMFLAKYTLDGDNVWFINIGKGLGRQRSTCLTIDLDGNLLIGGYFKDSIQLSDALTVYADNSFKDYFMAKIEPINGLAQWCKTIKSIDTNYSGFIYSISATDNNYYVSGAFADSIQIENDTIVSETQNFYDTHIMKSDKQGNFEWIRIIKGTNHEYSYTSSIDNEENIYATGYFDSPQLIVDSTDNQSIIVDQNGGGFDFFIVKYDSLGTLNWIRLNGGLGKDRLLRSEIYNNLLHVSGYFADTMYWGGIQLTTGGIADQDMFSASMDLDGNYRSANSFGGTSNSEEAGIAVFNTTDKLYNVIRSNSELLVLGDSIYTSTSGFDYIVLGVIGCLPISFDNTIPVDVTGCFGDSTGSIQLVASGGFGTPWQYSVDNGLSYFVSSYFSNLPAGDYQTIVIDAENCTEVGPLITLAQPDTLEALLVGTTDLVIRDDRWVNDDGSITVAAVGGTSAYSYWLYPGGTLQNNGTFVLEADDYAGLPEDSSMYVVVAVNDANNCGPVLTDSVEILMITGFETLSGMQVKVYPNPTSGNITIEMPFEGAECDMEVMNMSGQIVLRKKVYSSGGVITETLDLSDQAKGLYMLRINGEALQSAIMVK